MSNACRFGFVRRAALGAALVAAAVVSAPRGGHAEKGGRKTPAVARASAGSGVAAIQVDGPGPEVVSQPEAKTSAAEVIKALPSGQRWVDHINNDLMRFWMSDAARGRDGDFPTYRCNDGSLFNPSRPCLELMTLKTDKNACYEKQRWVVLPGREYLRAKSRQIFAYGVAFHMTGNPEYLALARQGVDWVRRNAIEPSGAAVSWWEVKDGKQVGAPAPELRTSQDMAYALAGMGFYYYLTRDPEVLPDIVRVKDYIFKTYYDPAQDMFVWAKAGDEARNKELVAQLDQVYGYMMLLTQSMPAPHRERWKADLVHLAHIMIEQFYSPRLNLFFGAVTDPAEMKAGAKHTDFGHSIKTMWLIYEIGRLTGNLDLMTWGAERAARVLDTAFDARTGTWARRLDDRGRIDHDKEWWIMAELDQTAGTLALRDPMYARYLPATYDHWLGTMVDKKHGEMHHAIGADGTVDPCWPKAHSWKNALHSTEHALVAYITTTQLKKEPTVLYYAFVQDPPAGDLHPYFFQGTAGGPPSPTGKAAGALKVKKVVFTSVR